MIQHDFSAILPPGGMSVMPLSEFPAERAAHVESHIADAMPSGDSFTSPAAFVRATVSVSGGAVYGQLRNTGSATANVVGHFILHGQFAVGAVILNGVSLPARFVHVDPGTSLWPAFRAAGWAVA